MKTVIIAGRKIQQASPRQGREHAELWTSNNNPVDYWDGSLDWTRHFDLHPVDPCPHYREGIKGYRPETWEWYRTACSRADAPHNDIHPRVIYLLEPHPEVPGSVGYPLDAIRNYWAGTSIPRRLTTTVDMQFALALMEGFDHIILHGVGYIDPDHGAKTALRPEWQMKHKGILWWIGFAEACDISVTIEGNSIFSPQERVYGYETSGRDMEVALRGLVLADIRRGRHVAKEDQ